MQELGVSRDYVSRGFEEKKCCVGENINSNQQLTPPLPVHYIQRNTDATFNYLSMAFEHR